MMKNVIHIIMGLFVVTVFGLTGCGGGGESGNDTTMATTNKVVSTITVVDGNNQSATVGAELPNALVAAIKNSEGQLIAGQTVNFKVITGGGSVFAGAATSDASGYVRELWTLGTGAGVQKVEVRAVDSNGVAVVFATFNATATAGTPQTISIVSGDNQQNIYQLQTLPLPAKVIVKDSYGNPTPAITVTFNAHYSNPALPQYGGAVSPVTVVTTSLGEAEAVWTMGLGATQELTATVTGLPPVTFYARPSKLPPGAPTTATKTNDLQAVAQHALLPQPLIIGVSDVHGNAVPNVQVVFSASSGSGYIKPVTTSTDSSGKVSWQGYLHTDGQQKVDATVSGLGSFTFSVNVTATNHPYDGKYVCFAPYNNSTFTFFINNGVLAVKDYSIGNDTFFSEIDGKLTAYTSTLKGYTRINFRGQLSIDSAQRAHGSGTFFEFNGSDMFNGYIDGDTWTGSRE
jgi:hypothetical protein